MTGEEVRALARGVIDVERPLKAARAGLATLSSPFAQTTRDIDDELTAAEQALEDLLYNLPRGLG